MKIKVYGFKFDMDKLPKAMKPTDVFEYMQLHAGTEAGKIYRYGTYLLPKLEGERSQDWWGGMILKIRDSNAFTKLTNKDGKLILTAETLAENENLVEITYFVAHSETGSGLLAHHYYGTSLVSFAHICKKVFALARKELAKSAIFEKSKKQQKNILKEFKGALELCQLCNDTDIKTLVKQLKRVTSFELKLATLETKETFLRGIIEKATHETLKLTFPPDVDVDLLAEDAYELSENDLVTNLKVTGYDSKKIRRDIHKDENPLVFHEFDYDDSTKGLVLDLENWARSIEDSDMIKKLIAVASGRSTIKLLESA